MSNLLSETASITSKTVHAFLCASLIAALSCSNHNVETKSNAQQVQISANDIARSSKAEDDLDGRAARLTELYKNSNCVEFVNAFPNRFEDFDSMYGFDEKKGERVLYSQYEHHIRFFFDCSGVTDLERLGKLIEIGISGRWGADASAMVQEAALDLIKKNPRQTAEILDALPDKKASSFWRFILDGPHPGDKEIIRKVDELRNLFGKNSKQSKLLVEEYRRLQAEWRDH